MSKFIIGSLAGALILFIWQFLSFGPLNIHASQMDHLPQQAEILDALAKSEVAPGEYFLPRATLEASMKENEAFQKNYVGKPWATIQYQEALNYKMSSNMIRGFAVDLIAVMLLAWILLQFGNLTLTNSILTSLSVGLIGYFTINYLDHI
ncbi:MAG: hypothetical protein ACJA01_004344 [Saprospiraceae bacterium]|jgi:hypothetical protein